MKKRQPAGSHIPTPADPQHRRERLPWQNPKSPEEDPDAPRRLQSIMDSPSYRQADQDTDFLNQDDTRGVRLQIDYQKTESALQKYEIEHTIVVFGSTRIGEPAAMQLKVDALRHQLDKDLHDDRLIRELSIAERLLANSKYYDIARDFSRLVSQATEHGRWVIMTGGGPGIMEAANRGAYDNSSQSIGLNIHLPHEQYPNPYITPELCFQFHYFALRKLHFMLRTRALVAFPGGYGTIDEVFEALTLIQTRKIKPVPIILVGERYWRQAVNMEFLIDEGVIDKEDSELFWYADSAREIWNGIVQWHEQNDCDAPTDED